MKTENKLNILIPNGTGPTNVGDQTILAGLIKVLDTSFSNYNLILHSSENKKYKNSTIKTIKPTLYSWAILDNLNPINRIINLGLLLLNIIILKLKLPIVGPKDLKNLINDYKNADVIFFAGGGYLRTQKGFTQSLNLLMLLLLFVYANNFNSKKVVAPMSFGPFAYDWQEKLSAKVLKPAKIIFAREANSHQHMEKLGLNPILTVDLALLLNSRKHKKNKKLTIGFTMRNWLPSSEQDKLEQSVADAIYQLSKKRDILIQPIVHVDAPKYGDFDKLVTEKIISRLSDSGIKTLKPKIVTSMEEGLKIYSMLDMLVGMRLHSDIMAALVGVPFIAIAYEYKTEGICNVLGVKDYAIKVQDVTEQKLVTLLNNLCSNYERISLKLNQNLIKIQQEQQFLIKKSLI